MKWMQLVTASALGALCLTSSAEASPRTSISLGFNFGVPYYRPWCGPYGYYRPYPIYYAAPPRVIIEPAPVVVAPGPVVVTSPASVAVTPAPSVIRATSAPGGSGLDAQLQLLTHPDESVRRDAVMELGRSKSEAVLDSLAATMAGDRSPVVRDAAARALGLIGSPRALTALIHAAQADSDRDVRRSAQFAVEVIQTNNRR